MPQLDYIAIIEDAGSRWEVVATEPGTQAGTVTLACVPLGTTVKAIVMDESDLAPAEAPAPEADPQS